MHSNSERFFKNPYPDYDYSKSLNQEQIINKKYLFEYLKTNAYSCISHLKPKSSSKYCNGKVYTGNLGLIFMCYKILNSNTFTEYENELKHYISQCISANEEYSETNPYPDSKDVAFLVGKGGLYIMGCIASKLLGHEVQAHKYASHYANLSLICEQIDFLKHGSDELFVGRAGYLCGLLVLKKYLNLEPLSKTEIFKICNSMIRSGKMYSHKVASPSPLMYAYHGTEYLGSAHGLAGILQILLSFPDYLKENSESEKLVKQSVDFLLSIQKPNGNFPSAMDELNHSLPRQDNKDLVHWCHGATGVAFLLAKAYLYWKDEKYLDACKKCGEVVWQRGLLKKGPGTCHGVAGSGYVHLLLYRLTYDLKYLYRAMKFAEFLQSDEFIQQARTPDSPYSLFEGLAGTVCFINDLLDSNNAEFPLLPVF